MAGLLIVHLRIKDNDQESQAEIAAKAEAGNTRSRTRKKVEDLIASDRIGVEIGYRLIRLVDKERGGTLT